VFREVHNVRKFRLVLCIDVYGCLVDASVRLLESAIKKEEVDGRFKYLTYSPAIIFERQPIHTRLEDDHAGGTNDCVIASAL
jgi:hypothetical protein